MSDSAVLATAGAQSSELERWLTVVRRRKWVILFCLVVAGAIGTVHYRLATRIYESRASILVVETGAALAAAQVGTVAPHQDHIPTHVRLIRSPVVLGNAVNQLRANADGVDGAAGIQPAAPSTSLLAQVSNRLKALGLGGPGAETASRPKGDKKQRPPITVETLAAGLRVTNDDETKVIDVAYRTAEPESAARIVDAVVNAYLQFVNETHKNTAREIIDVFTKQKTELERQLVQKEAELQRLQQQAGVLVLRDNEANIIMSRVTSLNDALTKARVDRMEAEARLNAFDSAVQQYQSAGLLSLPFLDPATKNLITAHLDKGQSGSLSGLNLAAQPSPISPAIELQRYRETYGPNHPRMRQIEAELASAHRSTDVTKLVRQALEQDLAEKRELEQQLQRSLETEKANAMAFNSRNVQVMALETEVQRLRDLFQVVINRIKEADLGSNYEQIRARVIRPPTRPTRPVSPNGLHIGMMAVCLGLGSGLFLAQILEWLDCSFHGPEDVKQRLALPILGHVPRLRDKDGRDLLADRKPRSSEAEAFRTVRTAICFAQPAPKRLVITSPESADGKTTLVCNLAVAFAQSGRRTLLLEADLRRPRVRQVFGLTSSGGLSTLLRQQSLDPHRLAAAIQPTAVENLWVLCAGGHPPNPAELLSGKPLQSILEWAASQFDQVLIDSPPALVVADACAIGRAADAVALVIRPDTTDRRTALHARDTLLDMGCNLVGTVINGVHPKQTYGYYYYYGYGAYQYRKYGAYYGTDQSSSEEGHENRSEPAGRSGAHGAAA